MSFEYNGVVYRDLEPQVRYDAEQIQLLKQADVTINENLQTVNTEIDGKLTKPTNPSAESAVTMLADGTVGTKLLSEIGGSGGKLYIHEFGILLDGSQYDQNHIVVLSEKGTKFTSLNDIPANSLVVGGDVSILDNGYYFCPIEPGTYSIDLSYFKDGQKIQATISSLDEYQTDIVTEL